MSVVVAIEQDYDDVTRCAQAFRTRTVYSHPTLSATSPEHSLRRCFNYNATPQRVHNELNAPDVRFVTGVGHGSYDLFTGQHGVTIWDAFSLPEGQFADKIVHLLSCQTGASLGLACVENGARAFWGYTVNFAFPVPANAMARDAETDMFLHMDAIIDRGILAGKDAETIYDSIVQYVSSTYAKLLANNSRWSAIFLDNFVHLVCPAVSWGDPSATI